MTTCFEIQDIHKFKGDGQFIQTLDAGIDKNIKTKSGNLGLSYIYRNIIQI